MRRSFLVLLAAAALLLSVSLLVVKDRPSRDRKPPETLAQSDPPVETVVAALKDTPVEPIKDVSLAADFSSAGSTRQADLEWASSVSRASEYCFPETAAHTRPSPAQDPYFSNDPYAGIFTEFLPRHLLPDVSLR
jgi:hypothetical protein